MSYFIKNEPSIIQFFVERCTHARHADGTKVLYDPITDEFLPQDSKPPFDEKFKVITKHWIGEVYSYRDKQWAKKRRLEFIQEVKDTFLQIGKDHQQYGSEKTSGVIWIVARKCGISERQVCEIMLEEWCRQADISIIDGPSLRTKKYTIVEIIACSYFTVFICLIIYIIFGWLRGHGII